MSTTKEKPILFSGAMVRAILDGTKTQTRRTGEYQLDHATELGVGYIGHKTRGTIAQATYRAFPGKGSARWAICAGRYGIPGERLWVQEGYRIDGEDCRVEEGLRVGLNRLHGEYLADGLSFAAEVTDSEHAKFHARKFPLRASPGRFMYRSLSRILLEITDLRVERLQSVSAADARAEGIRRPKDWETWSEHHDVLEYRMLWESINGPDSWQANPWVWVVEFKRITP